MRECGFNTRAAARMLLEEPVLESRQMREGDLRWLAIGVMDDIELAVVYVDWSGCRRIITARKAKRNERKRYYARFGGGTDPPKG